MNQIHKSRATLLAMLAFVLVIACDQTGKFGEPAAEQETIGMLTSNNGIADKLPSFKLQSRTGTTLDLASLKGKKVFVNFWATWCPPCVAEMPSIESLYKTSANNNVAFVMISVDEHAKDVEKFLQRKGYSLPVYFPADDFPPLFQVRGIPATFIFDEEGNLIFQHTGMENYQQDKFKKLFTQS